MRVLITTSIFPPDIGGPATYVPLIAHALHDRGHEVTVLASSDRANMAATEAYPFEVVRVNREESRFTRGLNLVRAAVIRGSGADVIFGNSTSMLEPALASRLLGKPYVLKVVGDGAWETARRRGWTEMSFDEFQETRASGRAEALRRLRTWHVRRARSVIVPSRYLAAVVQRWGVGDDRIEVVPNAVAPINGIEPAHLPFEAETKLVSVGRLVPWKHVDGVIEALPSLQSPGSRRCRRRS